MSRIAKNHGMGCFVPGCFDLHLMFIATVVPTKSDSDVILFNNF